MEGKIVNGKLYVRIEFELEYYLPNTMDEIYACGNDEKLGAWDPKKAMVLRKNKKGKYVGFRWFKVGSELEFKIIRTKDWDHVQLGTLCEEVQNHKFNVSDKYTYRGKIYNWLETK